MATKVPMATKAPMTTIKDKTESNLQKEQNVLLAVFGFICNMAMGLFWS